jgi:hypothetical protein
MLAASQDGLFSVTLNVIHCYEIGSHNGGKFKAATELSVLMKVYSICCSDGGHIIVMLVSQTCTDSLQDLPGSACETFPTSYNDTYDVGNVKVEEDIDIKEEEDDVKPEKGIGNKEEERIDFKCEGDVYSEEDIDTKEDVDGNVKEEVS